MVERRPPPPWKVLEFEPPTGARERVRAGQLRPDDWLVTNLGPLRVTDVDHSDVTVTRLRSNGRWWRVPSSTRFVRVKRSRKIEMRPDLKSNEEG